MSPGGSWNYRFKQLNFILFQLPSKKQQFGELHRFAGRKTVLPGDIYRTRILISLQKLGAIEPSWNVPGSLPEWKDCVVDRARSMLERDKNHAAVT